MLVSVRELRNRTSEIVRSVQARRTGAVIAYHGRPAALLLAIDSPEAQDYVLAPATSSLRRREKPKEDLRRGQTITLAEYRRHRGISP